MSFFQRFRLRRAAKAYALRLPDALRTGYGPKTHYRPGQIRAAVTKARLDPRFIALGYAAFMTEEAFNEVAGELPVAMSYAEARAALLALLKPGMIARYSDTLASSPGDGESGGGADT